MTRVTKRDRHRMRRKTAKLGEELLRIRDSHEYWRDGYETFREYVEQGFAPARAAAWGLTSEQAVELAEAAIEAATSRRLKTRRTAA